MVILGGFEEAVLLAVDALGDCAYSVAVRVAIEDAGDQHCASGAVFATLTRLEEKGFLGSWLGEITLRRGGRRKRYYRLTDLGRQRLAEAEVVRVRLRDAKQKHAA